MNRKHCTFRLAELYGKNVFTNSNLKNLYCSAKASKVGDTIICPSCKTKFTKTHYQQAFCKTYGGSVCKDFYWNNVTPTKRNNTTRISPASQEYIDRSEEHTSELKSPSENAYAVFCL